MQKDLSQQLIHVLQKKFYLSTFRPGQLDALLVLMTTGRLLCIQPTGYGKSLLYQLPALLLDGLTLVISPLLALIRDQVMQLQHRFGIKAASFNADQSYQENAIVQDALRRGEIRILFIAPEQLTNTQRFDFLLELPIKLLVIDEAHCISTWGHDFRPSYRQIIHLAKALACQTPDIKLLALTATATQKVERDIKYQLSIDHHAFIVHRESMDRPNIRLSVIRVNGASRKLATLIKALTHLKGCGLIYCATRENTELVAAFLNTQNIYTTAYHAGFSKVKKRALQQDFLQDKYQVIVATNALGMGIDKANLRFIIHFDFPGSLTAYYQEVGRCGRDGQHADGILFYDPSDGKIQSQLIELTHPTLEEVQAILALFSHRHTINVIMLKELSGLSMTKLSVLLAELTDQGFLKKTNMKGIATYHGIQNSKSPSLVRFKNQYMLKKIELHDMQCYAEQSQVCLMKILRNAFGDTKSHCCGKCSGCTTQALFSASKDEDYIMTINAWLDKSSLPIIFSKKNRRVAPGIAVLDGKLRQPLFTHFMQQRGKNPTLESSISYSLLQLIKECLLKLAKRHHFSCLVPIPSRTWLIQSQLLSHLAHYLRIPFLNNLLFWDPSPQNRQGELLSNEEREHNVSQLMQTTLDANIPPGAILLVDDYIGSGATMKEAVRALSGHTLLDHKIVPFTIASVRWQIGKKGIIK